MPPVCRLATGAPQRRGSLPALASGSKGETQGPKGEASVWVQPTEVVPLEKLLLPPEHARDGVQRLQLNQLALSGWVEQFSPCCAAASVAGMLNALRRVQSEDPSAVSASR
eukprot:3774026-Prymnesium_polylepis.1